MSTTPEVFVADKKLGFICAFTAATLMGFVGFFARHINAQGDFIAWSRMACGAILFFGILAYKGRLGDLKTYKISPSNAMQLFGGALIIFGGMSEMLLALLKGAAKKSQAKKAAPTAAA